MMNVRKYVQELGAHLSCSEPLHSGAQIKSGKDVAVSNENLDAARRYLDAVMRRLRRDILEHGVATADLKSVDADLSPWELHCGKIYGLDRISHDGRPWPLKTPSDDGDVDDVGSPQRFDVAAVVLLHDVCFETFYNYTSTTQTVEGQVSGKIAIVRLDMTIGHPETTDGVPEVNLFKVTEYTRVGIPKESVGVLNEKLIEKATEKVVHACIEDAMSYRVLPVLNNLLKAIPYPDFT